MHRMNKSLLSPSAQGLTPDAAVTLVRQALPDVQQWLCWSMGPDPAEHAVRSFIGEGVKTGGQVGSWSWEWVPCGYANLSFWCGDVKRKHVGSGWIGLVRITGACGSSFHLFSYLRVDLKLNHEYLVSTGDLDLLRRFAKDLMDFFDKDLDPNRIQINVVNGPDMSLDLTEREEVYLPGDLRQDIERQTYTFFSSGEMYREMGIPYRRGLLFTGPPGTGKTMMIRQLVRECYRRFKTRVNYLAITATTDDGDIARLFRTGDNRRPVMIILEEIDSISKETSITRANLLSQLDGLQSLTGALIIGTTNNPELIDPALVHRPSRFDRIWRFPLPDLALRRCYLASLFPEIKASVLDTIAKQTAEWTFAYLKELKVTAGMMVLSEGHKTIDPATLVRAHKLLGAQFRAGERGYDGKIGKEEVGFCPGDGLDLSNLIEVDNAFT